MAATVVKGVQLGLARHGAEAKTILEQAYAGLDEAFANAAEATALAVSELSGGARDFASGELHRALDDLKTLEQLYLGTLRDAARHGSDFASAALRTFVDHAALSGTAVGRQVGASAEQLAVPLARIAEAQWQEGVASGRATGTLLARAAAGFFAGIAERLEPPPQGGGR